MRIMNSSTNEWFNFSSVENFTEKWLVERITALCEEHTQELEICRKFDDLPIEHNQEYLEVDSKDEIQEVVQKYRALVSETWLLEHQKEICKKKIALKIQSNAGLKFSSGEFITWETHTTKRLDVQAIQSHHPNIAATYIKATSTRVMRFS